MKKVIIGLIIGLIIGTVTSVTASNSQSVQALFSKFTLMIDGQSHSIEPLVHNGTTYLPVRQTAGLLNLDVNYNDETRTIKLGDKGDGNVSNGSTTTDENFIMSARDLVELLGKKYPELTPENNRGFSKISFVPYEHKLVFDGSEYILKEIENGVYAIKPLLDEGVISPADLN